MRLARHVHTPSLPRNADCLSLFCSTQHSTHPLVKQTVKVPTEKWVAQDGGTVLLLPPGLKESELRQALANYTHFKVWW